MMIAQMQYEAPDAYSAIDEAERLLGDDIRQLDTDKVAQSAAMFWALVGDGRSLEERRADRFPYVPDDWPTTGEVVDIVHAAEWIPTMSQAQFKAWRDDGVMPWEDEPGYSESTRPWEW